jgi:hypothetical protein
MKLLLTLLSMVTLAAAGTITVKDFKDATCATADTECGVDDVDELGDGTCPNGKTTEELTKSLTFTVGTCMTAADGPDEVMKPAEDDPAASWKIVCSGGKDVVKLFTDSACATAIASAAVVDTAAYNAAMGGSMGAGSARRRSHSCAPLPQQFYL